MSDQKTSIGRVVAGVVDVQQTMALQFDSLSKGLEALKLEHQSGIAQLREDIRRSDDRSQKQLSEINACHSKELDRLHQIIQTLLTRDSSIGAAMVQPSQMQQQQQLLLLQRQMEIAHAHAQAQAQNQAMVNLMNAANGPQKPIVPVQQPLMATPTPQIKPQVPAQAVPVPVVPKPVPSEVTIPAAKPSFPSTSATLEKPTTAVVTEKPKPTTSTPVNPGFSFGTSSTSIFGKKPEAPTASTVVVPPTKAEEDEEKDDEDDYEPEGEFKPVVPLPDLVEVKTGEEGEQAVFTNRAKLYIYANETSEWKERGTGELKVLYNKDKKSWRVVMRRDQVTISEETLPSNNVNGTEELCWNIQVLKVCANFPIVGSMSIQQMKSNEKAYTWFCEDFSEDEPAHIKLSARFANVEIAAEFKKLFEKAVAEHKSGSTIDKEIKPADVKKEIKKEVKEEVEIPANNKDVNGFGEKFKPKPGSWECSGCYVTCKADEVECACCGTSKDGTTKEKNIFSKPSLLQPAPGTPKVTFGFGVSAPAKDPVTQTSQFGASLNGSPSTNSSIFGGGTPKGTSIFGGGSTNTPTFSFNKPAAASSATTPSFNFNKAGSTSSPAPASAQGNALFGGGLSKTETSVPAPSFSFNKASETSTPKASFSFGKQATSTGSPAPAEEKTSAETPKSVFGSFAQGGTTFASLAAKTTGSIFDSTNTQKAQQELAAQKKTSIFGSKSNTPNTTLASANDAEDATEDGDGEYEPEVDFKPVIPLPDLVEVKTGEEDEEVVFTARCKLYKYYTDLQENKERGLGDIKLLKSKENKYRIVMRREQVHKLCANFRIDKSIKLNPKPNLPNVLTFMCSDYSEDPANPDNAIFTAKFKDEAIATAFKDAVKEAQSTM